VIVDIVENYRTKYSGKMDTENVYKKLLLFGNTKQSKSRKPSWMILYLPNQISTCINLWKYKWYLLIKWVVLVMMRLYNLG
jgi:hypothetical protein